MFKYIAIALSILSVLFVILSSTAEETIYWTVFSENGMDYSAGLYKYEVTVKGMKTSGSFECDSGSTEQCVALKSARGLAQAAIAMAVISIIVYAPLAYMGNLEEQPNLTRGLAIGGMIVLLMEWIACFVACGSWTLYCSKRKLYLLPSIIFA